MSKNSPKNVIGPNLKKIRLTREEPVTQEELAARLAKMGLNLDRTALVRIENGQRLVRDIEILKLAQALDVRIELFFKGTYEAH